MGSWGGVHAQLGGLRFVLAWISSNGQAGLRARLWQLQRPSHAQGEVDVLPRSPCTPWQDIAAIAPVHNLGALSLDSQPLKHSLRSEAANWKAHFSSNIHKKAAADLQVHWQGTLGGHRT